MLDVKWTRRRVLQVLGGFGLTAACGSRMPAEDPELPWQQVPRIGDQGEPMSANTDDIRALMNVFIPAEFDSSGRMVSPGALEAGAYEMLELDNFVTAARAQGFLPELTRPVYAQLDGFDVGFRAVLHADLSALAATQRTATAFRQLSRDEQVEAIREGFDQNETAPVLSFVRAACFIAYVGAVFNDFGLQTLGYPPFENFKDGLAVSGYPRTTDGRLIDLAFEDLAAMTASGIVDDYTYNLAPLATPQDDLSLVLNSAGDIL